ncbi:MAG TPA: O-antigen ligase family protein, partial [Ramlibacter sp.]|nr:O-antigen ligase family protein [Ramlibacter sp.]
LIGLLITPVITNFMEAGVIIAVLASSELRGRLRLAARDPMVAGALAFFVVLAIGVTYSAGPLRDSLGMLSGWRKLLLLPVAAAVFDHPAAKRRLALTFVVVTTVLALLSYYSFGVGRMLVYFRDELPGMVVRNHSTQGAMFAAGSFTAVALLLAGCVAGIRRRALVATCALLLAANTIFVTDGRTGYVVLPVCAVALALGTLRARGVPTGRALLLTAGVVAVLGGLLLASPKARVELETGVSEMQNYRQEQQITRMGIRLYFWRNTLALIPQHPWFGFGTGSFGKIYGDAVRGRPGVAGTLTNDPHNQFLKIATEQGLAGLAVFLAFLWAATRQRASEPWRMLGLGLLAAWCVTSLANSHFSTFAEGTFIFIWAGAMLATEGRFRGSS